MHYSKLFTIPSSAIDANGHVNNVVYVQWMQDIAIEHYLALGFNGPVPEAGWVVAAHRVEYLLPAYEGEEIEIRTWVESLRRASLLRKYEFLRRTDGKTLVRGETDWVYVNIQTGRPQAIPPEVSGMLDLP